MPPSIQTNAQSPSARQRPGLRREIILILAFKLMALVALYFLFFDERPRITPMSIEQRVLDADPATESAQ